MFAVFISVIDELTDEAHRFGELRHPNIVRLIAYTFEKDHYGLILEYVKYDTVDKFVYHYVVRFATV